MESNAYFLTIYNSFDPDSRKFKESRMKGDFAKMLYLPLNMKMDRMRRFASLKNLLYKR